VREGLFGRTWNYIMRSLLNGRGGWRKLRNEELIWMKQEAGENYIMRSLFGWNRRLEKIT
jgi:hypothetical protein